MYCEYCGKLLPDQAKFCPRCGTETDPVEERPVQAAKTAGGGAYKINTVTAGTYNHTNVSTQKVLAVVDKTVAVLAAILMIATMIVPFTSVQAFRTETTYTLFESLDFTKIIISGNWMKPFFIVMYIALILSFIVFKFMGKTRSLPSIGCVGSWILLIFFVMLVITINDAVGNMEKLYLGTGLYIWAAGGILEIVSLVLDPRKPADSGREESQEIKEPTACA